MLRDRIQTLPAIVTAVSGIAVVIAAVALIMTRGHGDSTTATEQPTHSPSASSSVSVTPTTAATESTDASASTTATATHTAEPIVRKKIDVFVYNDTSTAGLAATVASTADKLGWHTIGTGNWHGDTPSTTVYYPAKLKAAAALLAKDLHIKRVHANDSSLPSTQLTVVLEGPLS